MACFFFIIDFLNFIFFYIKYSKLSINRISMEPKGLFELVGEFELKRVTMQRKLYRGESVRIMEVSNYGNSTVHIFHKKPFYKNLELR